MLSETEPFPLVGPADADVFYELLKDQDVCRLEPGLDDIPPEDLEPTACYFESTFEVVPGPRDPSTLCGEAILPGPQ